MDENIRNLLDEEIRNELEGLKSISQTDDEHSKAVDDLAKLYRLVIDEDKAKTENCDKRTEEKGKAVERYIRLGVEIAGIVLPLMFYAVWMKRGFEFEKTGTFTSPTFRTLFSRFRPTKV